MADTFKGIITADGKKRQLPYENVLKTPVSDETLSIQGAFADAKAAGDKFKEVKVETDSLKEDLTKLKNELLTEEIVEEIWGIDYIGFTFKNGYYDSGQGWSESSAYKSYYLVATYPFDFYMNPVTWDYLSVGKYNNGEVTKENFVERLRKNGSENNLPTKENPMHFEIGQVIVITVTSGVTSFEGVCVRTTNISKIGEIKNNLFLSVSKSESSITINQGSLEYIFMRDVNPSTNLDTWRIRNYKVNGKTYLNQEIEGVIKQKDADDFVGGYHGDEKYTSVTIFVDGKLVHENETFDTTNASRVTVFVKSEVYFCNTSNKAFTRYKQLDFFKNTLRITNKWIYEGDSSFIVQRYPCGMFSINTEDIYGYTTNFTPFLQNNIEAPSKQIIDKVEFYGDGFTICVKYTGEKDKTYYRGTVSYFGLENPKRMKAYLMGIYEYQSTRTLLTNDTIESEVEVSCY